MMKPRNFQLLIWLLGASVVTAGIVAWSQQYLPGDLTIYKIFPLFGLLAWSLMWTHYISGALKRYLDQKGPLLHTYFTITSTLVLALILLHPGLFLLQLWLDGFGPPPLSYLSVYADIASRIAIILGEISLIIFLSFELHRKFKNASWWKYVELANVVAMFAIFYHALRLGGVFAIEWYANLWFTYGILLVISMIYTYRYDKRNPS